MAVLDSSDFSSSDDWTVVSTSGTVTFNQDDSGRTYVRTTGGAGWNQNGIYRTAGTTAVAGQVIYIDFRSNALTADGVMMIADDAAGLNTNQGYGPYLYNGGPWALQDDGGIGDQNGTFNANTWTNVKIVLNVGGTLTAYYHEDDGTAQQDIVSWTALPEAATFTWTGDTIYFETNENGQTVDFSRFNYTDNGYITDPESALLDNSLFDSSDGWTVVTTSGSVTFNNDDSGRTYVRVVSASAWNQTGAYRTTQTVGAMGHVIYFDIRSGSDRWNNFYGGLQDSGTIAYSPMDFTNMGLSPSTQIIQTWNGDAALTWNFGGSGFQANTWYNTKWVINPGGTVSSYIHADDGTAQSDIVNWDLMGTTTIAKAGNHLGKDIYFQLGNFHSNAGGSNTFDMSRFNYTVDGAGAIQESSASSGKRAGKRLISMGQM